MMKRLEFADLFCGAGGTSTGAIEAAEMLGYQARLTAINHWPVAVATHEKNHPGARHLCTSIDDVNPRSLYREGELDLLWASPECTHHSVARGGRPINDQSRATAWCVVRWAEALRPGVILIENVPEFVSWGGICAKGRPLKSKRGHTFRAFVAALESLGYRVGWKTMCAADYGDPTTRVRLFVQAVRGKRKITWPDATHGTKAARPWVPAREIIDWSLTAPSIYERKTPLKPKTLQRIFEGLKKFGVETMTMSAGGPECAAKPVSEPLGTVLTRDHRGLAKPYLICMEHQGSARSADRPMPTVTTARAGAIGIAQPFLVELRGTRAEQVNKTSRSIDDPVSTVTGSGAHHCLVNPFLVQVAHGNGTDVKGDARRAKSVDEPLPTVCGSRGDMAVCSPALLPQQSGGRLRSIDEPAPTISTDGAVALVEPFLVSYYGNGGAYTVSEPLDTVTTKDRFGLARPVIEIRGERYLLDIGFRMLQPHELAAAQGFRRDYQFTGNKSEQVKQIGNAVPRHLARAICAAALSQNPDVNWIAERGGRAA